MLNGLLARKIGMTQIFEEDGTALPVTMLQSGPMTVVQKKTLEKEGCNHVQVGFAGWRTFGQCRTELFASNLADSIRICVGWRQRLESPRRVVQRLERFC